MPCKKYLRWHKLYITEVGWLTSRGLWKLRSCWNTCNFGTWLIILPFNKTFLISTIGDTQSGSYSSKLAYMAFSIGNSSSGWGSRTLLDCWPTCKTPCSLSLVWSGWWNNTTYPDCLCVCKAVWTAIFSVLGLLPLAPNQRTLVSVAGGARKSRQFLRR